MIIGEIFGSLDMKQILLTRVLLFIVILVISAPEQWTMIPVPVKLFKLIINELGTLLESAAAGDDQEDGDSDEV